jgi:magnesium-transporting ATPase (P-type)
MDPGAPLTVLHSCPGRLRVAVPALSVGQRAVLQGQLAALPGARRVEIGPVTGNVLVLFDPRRTDAPALLGAIQATLPEDEKREPVLPRIVHSSRGRLRIELPGAPRRELAAVEARVRHMRGVRLVRPSRLTGNVLVLFDPGAVSAADILAAFRAGFLDPGGAALGETGPHPPPPGTCARIPLPGLDRSPRLGRRVVRLLESKFGVRAWTGRLTGHVLVEYDEGRTQLEDVLAEVARLSLPELPGEDRPAHPLDPEPLAVGITRTVGALASILALTVRRLVAGRVLQREGVASLAANLLNLALGFPFLRRRLRHWLGRYNADLLAHGLSILTQTVADFPLGLILSTVEGVSLLNAVIARRAAWRHHEASLDGAASADPGSVIRLEAGMRVPLTAAVIEGTGTATGPTGLPIPLAPGSHAPAGAVLAGGPFVLELLDGKPFEPAPRPAPPPTLYDRYIRFIGPVSLAYAGFTLLRTSSPFRGLESLLLLNPRTAVIGREAANLGAAARCLRGGLTVVGTRPSRHVKLPDVLLLDGPRLLTSGLEVAAVLARTGMDEAGVLGLAADIAAAAGSPWGKVFPDGLGVPARDGTFNGLWASATVGNVRFTLGPPEDEPLVPDEFLEQHLGGYLLEVRIEAEALSLGFVALRPRLSAGVGELLEKCRRLGVAVELLPGGYVTAARALAGRVGLTLGPAEPAVQVVRRHQERGARVAFVSDSAEAAAAFDACDLAVALFSGRREFPARADLLAPDLRALGDLLEAGACRDLAVRDSVVLGAVANAVGAVLGWPARLGAERSSIAVYLAALAALGASWLRLRGGERPPSSLAHLHDPRPERWGRWRGEDVLRTFNTTAQGLSSDEAEARLIAGPHRQDSDHLLQALRRQFGQPINCLLAGGAGLTVLLVQPLGTVLLATTLSVNVAVGLWQQRQAEEAAEAIDQLDTATARVLRDGQSVIVPAAEVVPGDVLVLAPGQRVAADARLLDASGLEVGEAVLTGELLPVLKGPEMQGAERRIILQGSDVIAGSGVGVVVAVGRQTRLGTMLAARRAGPHAEAPLEARLEQVLRLALPVAAAGGVVTGLAGLIHGGAPAALLTLGVTAALSAIPDTLSLLAGVGQAGVVRRLAARDVLVRDLSAVEALGRVDVACLDKTGTLTEGRLAVRVVEPIVAASFELAEGAPEESASWKLAATNEVLLAAALASPHPDAPDAGAHPTDAAVVRAACEAGFEAELRQPRLRQTPFDSTRAYSAAVLPGRVCFKGAPERLALRCTHLGRAGARLDSASRAALLERVTQLGARGLRVLLVAEGPPDTNPDDPHRLTVLGLVGLSDPPRATAAAAVRRCLAAGVRVLMLTGDHPATARTVAQEAGLLLPGQDAVLRACDLADLPAEQLARRLPGVAVIARATPLDRLAIIEGLQRLGHVVAVTGDGVDDAPALRRADVGVARGRTGTQAARQSSDLVLLDDDVTALVETLVEGRGFWRNLRSGLGLLLGGNAGELGVVAGATALGAPLTPVQILLVNLLTDALPPLAVQLQPPEQQVAGQAREGLPALESGLRRDVLRRGLATGLPSLAASLLAHGLAGPAQAGAVGFTSLVATQLAQTLEAGREARVGPVGGAVAGSAALLLAALAVPPVRHFLGLVAPGPLGWGLVAGSSAASVVISRLMEAAGKLELEAPAWARELRRVVEQGGVPG